MRWGKWCWVFLVILPGVIEARDLSDTMHEPGVTGRLTVHSSIEGQNSSPLLANLRGHSWLTYESLDGRERWTVGTWDGGIAVGIRTSRRGVNVNLEKYRHPNIYRTVLITQAQYQRLRASIRIADEWSLEKNCSYFAAAIWNDVTGESLKNWTSNQDNEFKELLFGDIAGNRTIPLPSPAGLFDSIFMENGHAFNNDQNRIRHSYEIIYPPKVLLPEDMGFGLRNETGSSIRFQ